MYVSCYVCNYRFSEEAATEKQAREMLFSNVNYFFKYQLH